MANKLVAEATGRDTPFVISVPSVQKIVLVASWTRSWAMYKSGISLTWLKYGIVKRVGSLLIPKSPTSEFVGNPAVVNISLISEAKDSVSRPSASISILMGTFPTLLVRNANRLICSALILLPNFSFSSSICSTKFFDSTFAAVNRACPASFSATAARSLNCAAFAFASPACLIASAASFRVSPASLFNLEFTRSAINLALWLPKSSTPRARTRTTQKTPPIISRHRSRFLYTIGKNILAPISSPSPTTPTKTKMNPHSATDSQNLSDDESKGII